MDNKNSTNLPIILAISGASGSIYGLRLLQFLLEHKYGVELVISNSAKRVMAQELSLSLSSNLNEVKQQLLSYLKLNISDEYFSVWDHKNIAASISSGSFKTRGMVIIPASMGTVGAIASGTSDNLITRAADVCLKERRKLVIVPREMPFNTIHLENLLKLSRVGAVIAPASPGYYSKPKTLTDSIDFVIGKVLDLFEIDHSLFKRWSKTSDIFSYAMSSPE